MGSSITVRDIDPRDKSWLKREARQVGVSMEEFVRRLIRENRTKTEAVRSFRAAFRGGARGRSAAPGEFRNTGVATLNPWTAVSAGPQE